MVMTIGMVITEMASNIGGRHEYPSIRIGMHTGSAVERSGDWFGSTINTAARVTAAAAGGEVLGTSSTRA